MVEGSMLICVKLGALVCDDSEETLILRVHFIYGLFLFDKCVFISHLTHSLLGCTSKANEKIMFHFICYNPTSN